MLIGCKFSNVVFENCHFACCALVVQIFQTSDDVELIGCEFRKSSLYKTDTSDFFGENNQFDEKTINSLRLDLLSREIFKMQTNNL